MPSYTWTCDQHEWVVVAAVDNRDDPQECPKCGSLGKRNEFERQSIDKTSAGSWNQQSFNHGLGCWTKSTKHAEQIAASRGLVPVGNEPIENLHKIAEKKREEIREERWAEADRVKVYD